MNLCKTIAVSLLNCGKLPYFLRDNYANIQNFEQIIKHPITVLDILGKIDKNEYQTVNGFFEDIRLMQVNLNLIYGTKLSEMQNVTDLFQEIDFVCDHSL